MINVVLVISVLFKEDFLLEKSVTFRLWWSIFFLGNYNWIEVNFFIACRRKQAFPYSVWNPASLLPFTSIPIRKVLQNWSLFHFFKRQNSIGEWQKNGGKEKRREVRRRVVKIAVGCHPGPSLCGNEGLEATLLLPDAVRLLRSPLMHGPSHQDFSIRLPSTYTLPHTHVHTEACSA